MAADQVAPDVIGAHEIAQRLGVTVARVGQLRAAGKMPPATLLRCGPVWDRATATEWADARLADAAARA